MPRPRMPAHDVPWLIWVGDTSWKCQECGEAGRQPPFEDPGEFARRLKAIKDEHANCGTLDEPPTDDAPVEESAVEEPAEG